METGSMDGLPNARRDVGGSGVLPGMRGRHTVRAIGQAVLALLLVFGLGSSAASAADADATASVAVLAPLTVEKSSNLTFGALDPSHVRGTVALHTDGLRWASWVNLPGGPNAAVAAFTVSGAPNVAFAISLPKRIVLAPGDAGLQVTDFAHNAGLSPVLDPAGVRRFEIGAILRAGPSLAQGSHLATFNVTVSLD